MGRVVTEFPAWQFALEAQAVALGVDTIPPKFLTRIDGIGNANGHVGKNYMRHMFAGVAALMLGPVNFHRGIQQAESISDNSYHQPERGFASGYHMEGAPLSPERLAYVLDPNEKDYAELIEQYANFSARLIVG